MYLWSIVAFVSLAFHPSTEAQLRSLNNVHDFMAFVCIYTNWYKHMKEALCSLTMRFWPMRL